MPKPELMSAIKNLPAVDFQFVAGSDFFWSPKQRLITYNGKQLDNNSGKWALLHESAHALLNHQTYHTDYELLLMEVAAWAKAQTLGQELGFKINKEHIEDCLDTYRDWLHERSTCPSCSTVSTQQSANTYRCHNCYTSWQVSTSRFCRPYRLRKVASDKKIAEPKNQTTFA